jgi:transposase
MKMKEALMITSSHAEIGSKGCFGAHSANGNRFVERILSVRAACQQRQRHLLTFVTEAITAYWAGRPAPTLLPATALNVP